MGFNAPTWPHRSRNVRAECELLGRCSYKGGTGTDWCTLPVMAQRAWFAAAILPICSIACGSVARARDGGGDNAASDAGGDDAVFAWSEGAPCPLARFEANGAVIDGELWVMGGFTDSRLQVTRQIDVYDSATDSWRPGPNLPGAETHIGVATVGRDIIIVGGFSGTFSTGPRPPDVADVWRWSAADSAWNPASGTWIDHTPVPLARSEIGASTSAMSDGRLLVIGGSTAGVTPNSDVLVYDPAHDAWTALPSLPARRKGAVAARIGRSIIVTTGSPTSVEPSATTFIGCCF